MPYSKEELIIYEDADILVLNKPSGVVVNNSSTYNGVTIQDLLVEGGDAFWSEAEEESEFSQRNGVLHRLDKDTSGVLLIAKTEKAFAFLKKQFVDREIEKEYLAVVFGEISDKKIQINAPIGRSPRNRLLFAVVSGGREALTVAEKIKTISFDDEKFTLMRIFPHSGRTHQIRVHFSALNHAVACDPLYNTRRQFETSLKYFPRLMLHAAKITFIHPTSGKRVSFESKVPDEFTF